MPPSKDRSTETLVSELADRALIDRCVARRSVVEKEAAWEEIVRRYRRKVFGIAYKFTGRYEESEDLSQEIFSRLPISRSIRPRRRFRHLVAFEDMMQEINHLVEEMDEVSRKRYPVESLFLNTVTYENERLGAYMKTLTGGAEEAKAIDSGQAGQTGKTGEPESEDS